MAIQIFSNRKASGSNSGTVLADGRYALVAMAKKSVTFQGKTEATEFYVPLLARLDDSNNVVGVATVMKDDLRTRLMPKVFYDGNGKTELKNNSGTFVEAVDKAYADHSTELLDIVWFKHILSTLRGRTFGSKAEIGQMISAKGNRYTTAVYKLDFTGGTNLDLGNNILRETIIKFAEANQIKPEDIFALNPADSLTFVDNDGKAIE